MKEFQSDKISILKESFCIIQIESELGITYCNHFNEFAKSYNNNRDSERFIVTFLGCRN